MIDVEGSLLHGIIKDAIKKSEKLFDQVIGDKYHHTEKSQKKFLLKLIDEQLAELGFEEEGRNNSPSSDRKNQLKSKLTNKNAQKQRPMLKRISIFGKKRKMPPPRSSTSIPLPRRSISKREL